MSNWAYYNENDAQMAAWLRELIAVNAIAPGEVDERSIEDVLPGDVMGFTQCHFFAGLGAWSHALRRAGWSDERRVWTGSCPCQPFSSAGKGIGFDDERHLWPAWFWLISQCRPDVVYGEQTGGGSGYDWFSLVSSDLGGIGYTGNVKELPACGFGAMHRRYRLFFVAESANERYERSRRAWKRRNGFANNRDVGELGNAYCVQPEQSARPGTRSGETQNRWTRSKFARSGEAYGLADANGTGCTWQGQAQSGERRDNSLIIGGSAACATIDNRAVNVLRGAWADAEWIPCRDTDEHGRRKYRAIPRAVKSESEQMDDELAHDLGLVRLSGGVEVIVPLIEKGKARTMRLRGYGNAIVAEVAAHFIREYMDSVMVPERKEA